MFTPMSAELSEEELNRMEHLVEAATAGPWVSYVAGRDTDAAANFIELGSCNELGSFERIELVGGRIADQEFIAGARQALPRLLIEVRALRTRLHALLAAENSTELQANGHRVDGSALRRPAPI